MKATPGGRISKRGKFLRLHFLLAIFFVCGFILPTYHITRLRTPNGEIGNVLTETLADFMEGSLMESAPRASPEQRNERPDYHMIFSTGCDAQQHWESYVFFYHAKKVQQPGNVTRLVSGCSQEEEMELRQFHETKIRAMSDRFYVFFTPDFGREGKITKPYKYNNKPNSVYLWMKEVLGMDQPNRTQTVQDGIILLLDPDMVLLRPLLHNLSSQEMIYASSRPKGISHPFKGGTNVVRHGMPMAQQDGYLMSVWQQFNASYISDGGEFPVFERKDGEIYWNSGPPYMSTVRDMWAMSSLWKDYVPRVYEEYPELFAEMFGLIIAAVQLDLKHTLVKSLVVSSTTALHREGWAFIDNLPDNEVCNVDVWSENRRLPVILHYCGRYSLGKYFFSKYRLKKKFISCETPLLSMPSGEIHQLYSYWVRPPPDRGFSHTMDVHNITKTQAKREAFMLCGLISSVNEAARYYKTQHCVGSGNMSEVYNFHDDPYSQ